jgi:WD40 repeat protein
MFWERVNMGYRFWRQKVIVVFTVFAIAPVSCGPVKESAELGSASQPRDHGPPPPYEEWTVLDEQRLEQKDGIWNAAVSADGKTLATSSNRFLRLWDLSTDPPREKAALNIRGRSTALGFAPDGKTLFLGLPDHTLRLLDVTRPQITERLSLKDWPKNVWYVTHSPDGKTLAVGADDMTVWLYDVTADKPKEKNVLRVEKTTFGVKELFFTPEGKRLVLGTGGGAVRLWDVAAREPKELAAKEGVSDTFLLPMSLSPDGQFLAVARGKTVQLLDVTEDGFAEWMKLDKHTQGLRAVNFSPDGKLLASTGQDGQIVLWKVGLDKPILVKQRSGTFCEVLFVPESKDVRLIACNWNSGTIYLFKVGK